jgi:hypothetical protein
MRKISFKKLLKFFNLIIILSVFISGLLPVLLSCSAPETTFNNIIISEDIERYTNIPVNPKNEFDITSSQIFATIKYTGVKGMDSWHFKWININSGETMLDKNGKYNEKQNDKYFDGIVASNIFTTEDTKKIPPGNYKVEFYSNDVLIKSAIFKVNKPAMKILDIALTNKIDDKYAPIGAVAQFAPSDTVYACVKVDYSIIGNNFKVIWKTVDGKVINESEYGITSDYYEPSYIAFDFQYNAGIIQPGKYKVEIYLDKNLFNTLDFEVKRG